MKVERKCVFVGYPHGKKGWKLYDLDTGDIFVSRDVRFYEDEFPFSNPSDSEIENEVSSTPQDVGGYDVDDIIDKGIGQSVANGVSHDEEATVDILVSDVVLAASDVAEQSENRTSSQIEPTLGQGMREKWPSVKLREFVTNKIRKLSPSLSLPTAQHTSCTPYPMANYVNCDKFSLRHRIFIAAITKCVEPRSFKEAMLFAGWREAMQKEIQALIDNGTWVMEYLPSNKKALGSHWVYKIKYNSDGSIERLKARLVVFGNHQVEGVDYKETFAPMAKMVTVRAFLAIAAAKNWELHQMDVHNAFLHSDLDTELYMKVPLGFGVSKPNMVCRLRKSLYGLRQAPRCWFAKLAASLKKYGFLQSCSDYSLFTLHKADVQINVLVYVDDLIISGNDSAALVSFKSYLGNCFHMKDLDVLKYFLGIEVARNPTGIYLCQ